jgi:hypothetical protein
LWTFGAPAHADDDGFSVEWGAMRALQGGLALTGDRRGRIAVVSPPDLALAAATVESFVVALEGVGDDATIEVRARDGVGAAWRSLARSVVRNARATPAGFVLPCALPATWQSRDLHQLRIAVAPVRRTRVELRRIAILRRA